MAKDQQFLVDFNACAEHAARMSIEARDALTKGQPPAMHRDIFYDLLADIGGTEFKACMARKGRREYGEPSR